MACILSRKEGEAVVLYDRETRDVLCRVFVSSIQASGNVRIGLQADESIGFVREELWLRSGAATGVSAEKPEA